MEIQQLKGFCSVVKYGSFSSAAIKTFRTQSAISLQVKALEVEFLAKLFQRVGSTKMELTEEGKQLYELLAPIVEDLETVGARFDEARNRVNKGKLNIATHASVIAFLLPDVITAFQHDHPQIEFSIVNRHREDVVAMVKHGEADLGITSLTTIPPGLTYEPFATFKRLLICPKKHELLRRKRLTIEDLAKYPLIIAPRGSNTRSAIDRAFAAENLNYSLSMELTGHDAVKRYVASGLGLAIINEYYLQTIDKRTLGVRDISHCFGKAERGIVTRKGYLSLAAREFIKRVKGECGTS